MRNSGRLDCKGLARETEQSGVERASLFIDMPLARLCIFVDGLVELQLDGIGSALFKSIKAQLLAPEDDFKTFRPIFQFVS